MKHLITAAIEAATQSLRASESSGFLASPSLSPAPAAQATPEPLWLRLSDRAFGVVIGGDSLLPEGIRDGAEVFIEPEAPVVGNALVMAQGRGGRLVARRDIVPTSMEVVGVVASWRNCWKPVPAA